MELALVDAKIPPKHLMIHRDCHLILPICNSSAISPLANPSLYPLARKDRSESTDQNRALFPVYELFVRKKIMLDNFNYLPDIIY